ncbi:MAG: OmpW family outer membrane protein [Pseudomonadota bacterium]
MHFTSPCPTPFPARATAHLALLMFAALTAGPDALAQTQAHSLDYASPWSLRAGPAGVFFNSRTEAQLGGQDAPGAELGVQDNATVAMEVGYAVTPDWTARFVFGIPPVSALTAQGTLKQYMPPLTGKLGSVRYAPAVLSLTHGLGQWGPLRPYLGAGINYTWVVADNDGDVANLKVRSAWGRVLELGVDWPIDRSWSAFADVRKLFVSTSATGTVPALGGPPARVELRLDPVVLHIGVGYRF